jgi:hypothetical protein
VAPAILENWAFRFVSHQFYFFERPAEEVGETVCFVDPRLPMLRAHIRMVVVGTPTLENHQNSVQVLFETVSKLIPNFCCESCLITICHKRLV